MRSQSLRMGIPFILLMTMCGQPVIAQQQDRWVEEIGVQFALQLPSPSAGHAYFVELQSVRYALKENHVLAIQRSMSRLIMMLGRKEGDMSADTARWLLYVIGSVTPTQYLDRNAQSHLRLIQEFYVIDEVTDVLREAGGNTSEHPGGGLYAWEFSHPLSSWESRWLWNGHVHPVVTVGLGIVLLIAVSAAALLYRVLRDRPRKSTQTLSRGTHAA